ncbi:hypothetical protein JIN85_17295 [Luteolibacter pohnpeiensis]|uniref:Uncharacterized protein n=1 Tax=Luteolibacter pohnpeiensis TaxID=454153 RepID=A0A934SFE0_9BACT|nr:hypothetical protein [Luteolibacter pohnpeiensis]MBK1884178.1 hypothetical protein [Luteolibacter pohnpeiensis]
MKRKRNILIIAAFLILLLSILILVTKLTHSDKKEYAANRRSDRLRTQDYRHPKSSSIKITRQSIKNANSQTYIEQWLSISSNLKGLELADKHSQLIQDASNRLQGHELAEFLAYIINSKEYSSNRMAITVASLQLFEELPRNFEYPDMARWIAQFDDQKAKAELSYNLGIKFSKVAGHDAAIRNVMEQLVDTHSQQQFLTGQCTVLALSNPVRAFEEYQFFLPAEGDLSGMKVIAANIHQDFQKIFDIVSSNEISNTNGARQAVISRWAEEDPENAANYVVRNTESTTPEDLGTAVATWLTVDPNATLLWAQDLPNGDYRQAAMSRIVINMADSDPENAWNLAMHEKMDEGKEQLLRSIYTKWAKTDSSASEIAKKVLDNWEKK